QTAPPPACVQSDRIRQSMPGVVLRSLIAPFETTIVTDDTPQRIAIAVAQIIEMLGPCWPIVPDGTDELSGDAIAGGRRKKNSQLGRMHRRISTLLLLADGALKELPPNLGPARRKYIIKHCCIERSWCNRVDVYAKLSTFFRDRFGKANNCRL